MTGIQSGFSEFIVESVHGESLRQSWSTISQQLKSVQKGLSEAVLAQDDSQSCLEQIAKVLSSAAPVAALAWFEVGSDRSLSQPTLFISDSQPGQKQLAEALIAVSQTTAEEWKSRSMQVAVPETVPAPSGEEAAESGAFLTKTLTAIAAPATGSGGGVGILAGCFNAEGLPPDWLSALVESAASWIAFSRASKRIFELERELGATAAVVDLATRIESSDSRDKACRVLAEQISKFTECETVAIGVCRPGQGPVKLQAVSDGREIRASSDSTREFEAAFDEVAIHESVCLWPAEQATERHGLLTLRQVATREEAECVIGTPIQDREGRTVGACLLVGDLSLHDSAEIRQFVEACAHRIGGSLELVRRAERSYLRRLVGKLTGSEEGRSPARTVATVCLILMGLMAIPVPYKVKCESELQPVVRRFVAAPFDGTLKKSSVEPGDLVSRNQLLARLDDREINWELAGLVAEHSRASKERDAYLATQDIAAAQLSKFDMERLEQRQKLLAHRTDHLEIRSPVDGLVIAGDLEKSEGVPLETGQTLFEIAPLDQMLVEVAIPEADIAYVEVGQIVALKLEAFPNESWTGTLKRIHPRSEVRDQQHVFIGEVELRNENGNLRPGMQGTARVETSSWPLGWVVLHGPWESFLLWMGW
jgi:hypothetical protein